MNVQAGDMVYDPIRKLVGMVTDPVRSGGWRIEWSTDHDEACIQYMWEHEAEHYKMRWEWLKADIANGRY